MPFVHPPFDVVAVAALHATHAERAAQTIASDTTASASSSPAPTGSPSPAPASSSAPPDTVSASSEAPRPRRHRRRVRAHRTSRRRTRGVRRTERRGPMVVITTRYTGIPTEGSPGPTWTARFTGFPLAGSTHAARYVRFALGGELGFRAAPHDRLDTIAWALVDLGFQYPFRTITPFATGIVTAGMAERSRFDHGIFEFAWQIGAEVGIDLRPPRSPVGVELAGGIGRTGIGDQWTLNGWVRFGLAFF